MTHDAVGSDAMVGIDDIVITSAATSAGSAAGTPSVTNATTNEDTQTTSGLVITANAASGGATAFYKITGITNGTLFKSNGTTAITNGSFITKAEGAAGLKFTPAANFFGTASFGIQASTSNVDTGLGGSVVTATITVNPIADTPSITGAATPTNAQTTSGLVVTRNAADGAEVAYFKVTSIQNGTLFLNDGTTPVTGGSFITFAQANAGLKFTPVTNFVGFGSVGTQASLSNTDAGLGGSVTTAFINVTAAGNRIEVNEDSDPVVRSLADMLAGGGVSYTVAQSNTTGLITPTINGTDLSLAFAPNGYGYSYLRVMASNGVQTVTRYFEVLVLPVDDLVADRYVAPAGGSVTFNVLTNDGAPDTVRLVEAGNLKVVQNDILNNTTSVTVTFPQGTPDMQVRDGSNRGDYNIQIGSDASDDIANGQLFSSVRENGRDNGEASPLNGVRYVTSAVERTASGYYLPQTEAPSGDEYNTNLAAAYFPYAQGWLTGTISNTTNNGTYNTLFTGPGTGLTIGVNVVQEDADGFARVSIPGVNSQTDGLLLAVGGKNEDNFSLARANADGSWSVITKDNGTNSGGGENDPAVFIYTPRNAPNVVSGRILGDGTVQLASGAATVTKTGTGAYTLSIPGQSELTGTLLISPEGGDNLNVDNIVTYQASGNNFIIQTRDLPTPTLQNVGAAEGVASFAFIPFLNVRPTRVTSAQSPSGMANVSAEGATLTINANGTVGYDTSTVPNYAARYAAGTFSDSFTYTTTNLNGITTTTTVTISLPAGTPSATNATTNEDTQTTSGLVITNNATAGDGTQFYKVTGITNGTLFKSDGTTPINNGDFITKAEGAAGLKFTPAANFFGTGSFDIQASNTGTDAGLGGSAVTTTVTVNPVADTPSVTNATTNEDTQTTDGLVISRNAVDGAEVTHFKVTNIQNGTLFLSDGATPVTAGTFLTFAQANAGLKFTPAADFVGTGSFDLRASISNTDAGLGGSVVTATITVNPVNDAPVLTGVNALFATYEDDLTNTGTLVSQLIATRITDADGLALTGVALVGVDTTNGTLQYTTDGGSTWVDVGAVSDASALLLAADADTRLRFLPNADFYSFAPFVIGAIRAWDQSSGTAGTKVGTAINGGGTTFSTAVFDFTTAIISVADTPSATDATTEANTQTTGGLVLTRNPVDGPDINFFKITNITNGTLFKNDGVTPINDGDFITDIEGNAGLKFTPAPGFVGNGSFQVQASGGDNSVGGSVVTVTIVVTPAFTPAVTNATTNEDTPTAGGLVVATNPNDGGATAFFKVTGVANGTLFKSDGTTAITDGDFITKAEGAVGLKFTPAADFFGSGSFQIQASTSNTDEGLGGNVVTATITVNPVADTPIVTDATTDEDTQTTSGLVISRNAADSTEVGFFKITNITNGTLFLSGGSPPASNGDFITFAQANAGLKFTPAANFVGTGSFDIQASLSNTDAGLGGSVVTATVTVNPVNDAPTVLLAVPNVTVNQDSGPFSRSEFAAFLPGGGTDEFSQTPTYTVTNNNNALFSAQPSIAPDGTLTFTPAPGANATATVTVFVTDNGGSANGGSATSATITFTITVVAAPVVVVPPVTGTGTEPPVTGTKVGIATSAQFIALGTDVGTLGTVRVLSAGTRAPVRDLVPFPGFTGGIKVALGDVNGDGRDDLIVGTATQGSHVKVFDIATGAELRSFLAFPGFTGGVDLAAGDIDGDGKTDVVVGTAAQSSHVKVFGGATGAELRSFLAFPGFTGGVKVAAGDVTGDGRADLAVLAGPGGNGHIKVFDGATGALVTSFLGYVGYLGDIDLSVGDVDGNGTAEVVTAAQNPTNGTHLKAFNKNAQAVRSFFAPTAPGTTFQRSDQFPVPIPGTTARVSVDDVNGDGIADYLLGSQPSAGASTLTLVNGVNGATMDTRFAFDPVYGLGIYVGV